MDYRLNPDCLRSIFAVPADVVDRHLKLASGAQLKVLLRLLRGGTDEAADLSALSASAGVPEAEAADALLYWAGAGILCAQGDEASAEQAAVAAQTAAAKAPAAKPAGSISTARRILPTREEVAVRGTESKEIAFLLREAQLKFGRLLRPNEASLLVWLHDDEGLPVSVLLMLLEYAAAERSLTAGFLERTAVSWIDRGVRDVAGAERCIVDARAQRDAWSLVCRAMGIDRRNPSAKEREIAVRWVQEWGVSSELLRLAYDACVDRSGKFSMKYLDSILTDWHKHGVTDAESLERYEQTRKTAKSREKKTAEPSYDLNLIEQTLFGTGAK